MELQPRRKRNHLRLAVLQLRDSAVLGHQDPAVVGLDQCIDAIGRIGHRIDLRRARLPSPETCHRSRPQVAPAVLVQGGHAGTETSILSVTFGLAAADRAEPSHWESPAPDPYRSFAVLEQSFDEVAVEFGVTSQPPVFQTGKASSGPNPETTVSRGTQRSDIAAGQVRSRWRVPGDAPNSIEPEQAGVRANPEIAIRRLSNGEDDAGEEPVADLPGRVCVLTDIEGRVQR